MPLSSVERADVLSAISAALEVDVHDELLAFYAVAVGLSESLPEQVNNEFRNAVTHFARALRASDKASADSDIHKGRGHIDRAKRDALKLILITLHDRIQAAIAEIVMHNGSINTAFVVRRNALTSQRANVFLAEARGDPNTLNMLVNMYVEADTLYAELIATHHLVSTRVPGWRLGLYALERRFWLVFWTIVGGLATGIAGFLVCAYFWPDTNVLNRQMRSVGAIFSATDGSTTAANSPSSGGSRGELAPKK